MIKQFICECFRSQGFASSRDGNQTAGYKLVLFLAIKLHVVPSNHVHDRKILASPLVGGGLGSWVLLSCVSQYMLFRFTLLLLQRRRLQTGAR